MSWSEAKIDFQNALGLARAQAFRLKKSMRGYGFYDNKANSLIEESNDLLKKIEKSEQFLASLEEIRGFCPEIKEELLVQFLNTARVALRNPQAAGNYKALYDLHTKVSSKITPIDKEIVKIQSEVNKQDCYLGLGIIAASLYFTGVIILTAAPMLLIGLAVAGTLAALALIAISLYGVYKNSQFIKDKQHKDIADFVQAFDTSPKPPSIESDDVSDFVIATQEGLPYRNFGLTK